MITARASLSSEKLTSSFLIAYSLEENIENPNCFSPTIKDIGLFPIFDCIVAHDFRIYNSNGGWFGNFETSTIFK